MSENKNRCFIFLGTMIQRLDETSFLGKPMQKGLVSGTGDRAFYIESFQWLFFV